MKRDEVGFLYLSVSEDGRGLQSAIRACLLVVPLDLFLSIAKNLIVPLQIAKKKKKKN
jgi:hypothetical protein